MVRFRVNKWSPKYPTDSQIITWLFKTYFERINREGNEYYKNVKFYYDYMDYRAQYRKDNESMLAIINVTPHNYAPLYKVISGKLEFDCYPDEDNVFSAILYFLYIVKEERNGYFGSNIQNILSEIFPF